MILLSINIVFDVDVNLTQEPKMGKKFEFLAEIGYLWLRSCFTCALGCLGRCTAKRSMRP
jgi:hypothetical protein